MPLDLNTAPRTLTHAKHLITALAWSCFFLYSIYLLLDATLGPKSLNIFHVLIPVPLLLVSIRAVRRYVQIRTQEGP